MKNVTLLIILLFISFSLSAQFETFDLSGYKLPDIKRHKLDFHFNLDGNTDSEFFLFQNATDTIDRSSGSIDFSGELDYSFYRNSLKTQQGLNVSFEYNQNKQKKFHWNNSSEDLKNRGSSSYFDVTYNYNYFPNSNKFFLTLGPRVRLSYSKQYDLIKDQKIESELQNNNSLGIGLGYGRIERVEDFRHAVLIIKEFEKRGVLNKNPEEKDIYKLAELISELKNERFFDSRKQREKELTLVNQYLADNDIISETGISYFVGLEDIWSYGGLQSRLNGNQIKLMITPKSSYQKIDWDNYGYSKYNSSELLTSIQYNSYKPLSIKVQRNYKVEAYNYYSDFYNAIFEDSQNKYFTSGLSGSLGIGFFPSTRTDISFNCEYNIYYLSDDKIFSGGNFNNSFSIYSSGNYYVSERFRIGYQLKYSNFVWDISNNTENNHNRNSSFSVNMNYAIF